MEVKEKKKNGFFIGSLVFFGCMFIGAGIGMLNNSEDIGGAIGIGVGFIAMGAILAYYRNKKM